LDLFKLGRRLVRTWTHLERQRGGYGFLGDLGETQLEADRSINRGRSFNVPQTASGAAVTRIRHGHAKDWACQHSSFLLIVYSKQH
jgi:50S ribosomal subunit-associated GTPase HflX